MAESKIYQPQPGMQTEFLRASEFECFYGGQAGGGKSYALLLAPTRYIHVPNFKAVIFRRTYPDLEDLIHQARELYVPLGAKYNDSRHIFVFPNQARIMFRHMQHIKDIYSHQGKEYDFVGFDELPQFPQLAYTYLFSRVRGVNPEIRKMIRATGNPDGEGLLWVKNRFFDPLDPLETGYFKTFGGKDTKVRKGTPGAVSRKFIPCIRNENKALMDADPEYEARLDQLPEDKKRALKEGLWTLLDRDNQLIQTEWWEKATSGKNEYINDGTYTIGADYGTHTGIDHSVEVLGRGNQVYRIRSWEKTRTNEFAQILYKTAKSVAFSKCMIGVDSIGPGCGVGDELESYSDIGGRIDRCTHKDERFDEQYHGSIKFDNLRSQMWWKFKVDMEEGNIDLSPLLKHNEDNPEEGYFDNFNRLQEEILAHTFDVVNGKLIVISKKELRKPEKLGRSPDYADALVIWNWTRRHHGEGYSIDLDAEYQVDSYMETWFAETDEYDSSIDSADYPDFEYEDKAEYVD